VVFIVGELNLCYHTQSSLIRLLTRILFVWFLKEKGLINKDLFELEELKKLIIYEKNSSFYKAILGGLNCFGCGFRGFYRWGT
jgi:hypothetical protein